MDFWAATFEDPWSVPLGSPLAGIGRVARTISILDASLSLVGSWGTIGGLVASGSTPLVTSASSSFTIGYSVTFGGLTEEGRAFSDPLFFGSATSREVSTLELLEEGGRMASG